MGRSSMTFLNLSGSPFLTYSQKWKNWRFLQSRVIHICFYNLEKKNDWLWRRYYFQSWGRILVFHVSQISKWNCAIDKRNLQFVLQSTKLWSSATGSYLRFYCFLLKVPLDRLTDPDAVMASEPTLSTLASEAEASSSTQKFDDALFSETNAFSSSISGRTKEQMRKYYIRSLHKVVDQSDIILLVLDARDPEGCRSRLVEEEVRRRESEGKKLVFVLNKIGKFFSNQTWKMLLI